MITRLLLFSCFLHAILPTQGQPGSAAAGKQIEGILQKISEFRTAEGKSDSIAGQPLGAEKESDYLRRYTFFASINDELHAIGASGLSFDDQVNLDLLQYNVDEEISTWRFKLYLNPILSDEGFQTELAALGSSVPVTKQEFEDYIRKLKDIPRYVEDKFVLMRKGLAMGISQPRSILNGYENTYEQHIVSDPEKSVFWKPFLNRPFGMPDAEWNALLLEGKKAVSDAAIEGFRRIKRFFDTEYLPKTRTTIGVSNFPDGLAFYQDRVRHYTTTDLSYDQVYALGLQEVARIKKEMEGVLKEVNFKGTLQEFIAWLRSAPRFYATSAEQLLKEASFIAKKVDGMLPAYFGKLPRQPYGVAAVPDYLAPTYTAGRYFGASIYSRTAAYYVVNTFDLPSRPLYALEALTLHESVPGHHLQISLAQELTNLPEFRRNLYVNAFGEGWGLYAEWLGTEMGFYKDPYSHFGKLTYEMWRACRLVLDVALHTKGWSRDQAVAYLSENTALSLREVNTEVNRYISWPGQALAYKMGELKIREMRKRAEEKLGSKFDIREFHDAVLSQGSVTLAILEKMIDSYIAKKAAEVK